jgi:hypothetical protein
MTVRIESQKAMTAATKSLAVCYLCGKSVAESVPSDISVEHVIPKGTLPRLDKLPPEVTPIGEAWPITLRVHKDCEKAIKAKYDHVFVELHRAAARNEMGDTSRGRGTLRKLLPLDAHKSSLPLLNAEAALKSISLCVKGLHAALYGAAVPVEKRIWIWGPTRFVSPKSRRPIEQQIALDDKLSNNVLRMLVGAIDTNVWDGITAWSGTVVYKCFWTLRPIPKEDRFLCLWGLGTADTAQWSMQMFCDVRPWHGMYRSPTLPPGASLITDEALAQMDGVAAKRQSSQTIRSMFDRNGRA